MRFLPLPSIFVLLLSLPASAALAGPHLRWVACLGETGAAVDYSFACDRNTGAEPLVLSLASPVVIDHVLGFEASLLMMTDSATLPSWWELNGCRMNSMMADRELNPAWSSCTDFFNGDPSVVFASAVSIGYLGPNRARWLFAAFAPDSAALTIAPASGELFLAHWLIQNRLTTGAQACGGCTTQACLVVGSVVVNRPAGEGDYKLAGGENQDQQFFVTWQSATSASCPSVSPTARRTWGQIKAQYR